MNKQKDFSRPIEIDSSGVYLMQQLMAMYSLWSLVIDSVVFSLSCVSIGDVQARAVPALTAANETVEEIGRQNCH